MARNIREPIPLPVILAASEGDERALNAVLNHYKGYIRFLAWYLNRIGAINAP